MSQGAGMKRQPAATLESGAPDAQLAARAGRGETAAFETLMRRHNRTLFRTARAILRDDAEAEDALQEAYLQAYRSLGEFRGEAQLSTWLARIVANEATVPPDQTAQVEIRMEKPDAAAQRAQMRRLLESQIDALPDAYRAVFM